MTALFSEYAFNAALVHQVVVAWFAGGRQGSVAQKGRGKVRGGGRKPWRQKGTGRARAGSIRSPLWRGGGVHFPASPRDHSLRVNRKMYRAAMRAILGERSRRNDIQSVEQLSVAEPRTRLAIEMLQGLGVEGQVLLVVSEHDDILNLAVRNLHQIELLHVRQLNPAVLLSADSIVVTAPALAQIEQWLT